MGLRATIYGGSKFPIVSDPHAQAFIYATKIKNRNIANALNQLCIDFKTNFLWDKMGVIYPMVGGTGFTHKFNLKDARDLDIAYRIIFNGVQTHDSQGALCTSPSSTFFKPSYIPNFLNDYHISYYTGSNFLYPDTVGSLTIGAPGGGNDTYSLIVNRTNYPCVSWLGSLINFGSTGVAGLVSGVRINTSNKVFLNGILKNTLVGGNALSGAINNNTIIFGGANAKCQYASISSSLTDAEALIHYNIIQQFQTTLGRQV